MLQCLRFSVPLNGQKIELCNEISSETGIYTIRARVQIRGPCSLFTIKRSNNTMTSRTLHNAATSWITYYSTFPAGSRDGALVGGLGDEVSQLKVVTSKFYAFLVLIHTHYMKSKHWLLKTKTTKHNSNLQIVRQYELLSTSVWKKWAKQLGTLNMSRFWIFFKNLKT